jgi:acetyl esterase/lipase
MGRAIDVVDGSWRRGREMTVAAPTIAVDGSVFAFRPPVPKWRREASALDGREKMSVRSKLRGKGRVAALCIVIVLVAAACWTPSFTPGTYAVTVTSDIVYGQGEIGGGGTFTDLKLDLYSPQDTGQTELPLVVVVHGGGFVSGSKTQQNVVSWSKAFAARGYLVASIDYRLAGTRPVPSARVEPLREFVVSQGGDPQSLAAVAAIDDTLKAMDFLLARPDTNPVQTILVGGSAGAVTVDHVAYALDDFGIERPPVAAVISNWGGLPIGAGADLIQNAPAQSEPLFWEPPIFLAHATGDPTVPYAWATAIADRADEVGLDHRLYTKVGNVHGFDLSAEQYAPGVSVLEAQIDFVTCTLYPHLAGTPDCA